MTKLEEEGRRRAGRREEKAVISRVNQRDFTQDEEEEDGVEVGRWRWAGGGGGGQVEKVEVGR